MQVLWVGNRVVSPGLWLKHQHHLGGLELPFVKDIGISTTNTIRGRVHVLGAASRVTLKEIVRRVLSEPRVA